MGITWQYFCATEGGWEEEILKDLFAKVTDTSKGNCVGREKFAVDNKVTINA